MADLSFLYQATSSISAVDADYEARNVPRLHLGISAIGAKCPRELWYRHNGAVGRQPEGRVLRLFKLGNVLEDQIIIDLRSAGFYVHSQQKAVQFERNGLLLKGSCDGIIEFLLESSKPHLLEIKTASNKRFTELLKVGYEKWDQKYKSQVHVYAYGLKLDRIYVVVYNKDTSELYAERIRVDKQFAKDMIHRAFDVMEARIAPPRKCPNQTWYEAKWCSFCEICFAEPTQPTVAKNKILSAW